MEPSNLIKGGVYAAKSTDGFIIWKIIEIDEWSVYATHYREVFAELPISVDTKSLTPFIVATPIAPEGFEGTLVGQEKVTEGEIADYLSQLRFQAGDYS